MDARPSTALDIYDLSFTHGRAKKPTLDRLTLRVGEGTVTGLLGPNGAGKTTLVSLVCGILDGHAGEIKVFGHPTTMRAARQMIGYCPQDLALYTTLTARENLAFFGRMAGLRAAELRERVDACLEIASLTSASRQRVEQYSGGMKRRLNLAAALVHEPRLLILDEPTVGVDMQSRLAIFQALDVLSEQGTTILYTTHYMEEVERLCDEVIVIDHGRVLTNGPTRELVARGQRAQTFRLAVAAKRSAQELAEETEWNGVRAHVLSEEQLEVSADDVPALLSEITRMLERGEITGFETHQPTLEERFLELTREELRD